MTQRITYLFLLFFCLLLSSAYGQGYTLRPQVGLSHYLLGTLRYQIGDYALSYHGYADPPTIQVGLVGTASLGKSWSGRVQVQHYTLQPSFRLRNSNLPAPQLTESAFYYASIKVYSFGLAISKTIGPVTIFAGGKAMLHSRRYEDPLNTSLYTATFTQIYERLDDSLPGGQVAWYAGVDLPVHFLTLSLEVQPLLAIDKVSTPLGDFLFTQSALFYLFSVGYEFPLGRKEGP